MTIAREIPSQIMDSLRYPGSDARISHKRLLQTHSSIYQWIEYGLYLVAGVLPLIVHLQLADTQFSTQYRYLLVIASLMMMLIYPSFGIGRRSVSGVEGLKRLAKAWGTVLLLLAAVGFVTKTSESVSREVLVFWAISSYCLQGLVNVLCVRVKRYTRKVSSERCSSVIVGSGDIVYQLASRMAGNIWLDERLVAVCDFANSARSYDLPDGVRSIYNFDDLSSLIDRKQVRRVYIALSLKETPHLVEQYNALKDKQLDIVWVPDIYEFELLNHCVREMAGLPLITLNESPHYSGARNFVKSLMDRVAAAMLLVLLSPVMVTLAILVKRSSPGPAFFKQERDGWDGSTFKVYKFRSMYQHQPENLVQQATKDDPRITPIGAFLRKSSLDELPQLINVLLGNMSLVGPRPHAVSHNNYYSDKIKQYMARSRVKPGMTGLAQIRGFRGETADIAEMEARVRCDVEYINRWSPLLDLKILLLTPFKLISKKAY
ncbi:undecaprenyl-phosphate glucose phosphotransferase [Halioxenophilus sp. WMMB6]|uniref:undecaprenyl-phosphate glucose phosphotransferase n=1 Tax=Halioxenophilus sp. WMMB6 TaxID=3073815 RepID=UPI00295F065D|nr:undecaprenyl-phosphate glucose phosphotransferase [Halioxenophilus sp. WMMB6]